MGMVLKVKKNTHIDANAVLVYLIMFFSNDTYLFGTNSNAMVVTFSRYMLIAMCMLLLLKMNFKINLTAQKGKIIAYAFIVAAYIVIAIINNELFNRVIIKVLCITVAFLLCMLLNFDEYIEAFKKAIYFVSISAVAFTLLAYILPGVVRMFPYIVNTAGIKIYTCLFAGLIDGTIGNLAIRTQGIYWEPGVFQLYLNLAIAFELFGRRAINRNRLMIYFIALILTFSTTGYAAGAWIMLAYALVVRKQGDTTTSITKRFLIVTGLFFAAVVVLLCTEVGDVVLGKVINPTSSGTAMVRLAGVVVNIEIALQHPWHGIGMEAITEEFVRVSMASNIVLGWTEQNTNTLFYQFAAHGIPYGILFTIGTFKFGNNFPGRKKLVWIVFVTLVLMYVGENLQYSSLPYILIFYGFGWKDKGNRFLETHE
ncbi:hypothetical protein [Holdemania massiliensis]|uniref:hypothetical protein n=1 Tax=Holdemania massiliensis TaxID=1468449 RepID=UPI001F06DF35|nr:hypothetical protein [Holdemania massiliensis]MCH1940969.1 hypothetical protein [Holdemania massiliensis]